MSQTVPQKDKGSKKVKFARFVGAFTNGKFIDKKLLRVRDDKVRAALAAVKYQIDRLEASGVRNLVLDHKYADLLAAHAVARSHPDEAERYHALETVKQNARAAMAEAEEIVDGSLANLPAFLTMQQNARRALEAAEPAVKQIGVPEFRQDLELKLWSCQGQFNTASSRKDGESLKSDTEQLRNCALNAGLLAKEATRCAEKLARRTKLLAEIDTSLADLRAWGRRKEYQPALTEMEKERAQLGNGGPKELEDELKRGRWLLSWCQSAVYDCEDEDKREKAEYQQGKELLAERAKRSAWDKTKALRDRMRTEADQYAAFGKQQNQPELVNYCDQLKSNLDGLEVRSINNPEEATDLLLGKAMTAFHHLKEGTWRAVSSVLPPPPGGHLPVGSALSPASSADRKPMKAEVQATQATGWDQAIPDPRHPTAAHKTAAQDNEWDKINEWDKTKGLRDQMRTDADEYATFGKQENHQELVHRSEQLKGDLKNLEALSKDDPELAADLLQRKLGADHKRLKAGFAEIVAYLQPLQAERTKLLTEIDASLADLRTWVSKKEYQHLDDALTKLEQERDQLANAGPAALENELKKEPSLLARCQKLFDDLVDQDRRAQLEEQAKQARFEELRGKQSPPDPQLMSPPDQQPMTAAHKTATQDNEWDETKALRDQMRADADNYTAFGEQQNQKALEYSSEQLVRFSKKLKDDLEKLEALGKDNPKQAADQLQQQLPGDYNYLKELFGEISTCLQLFQKVEDLIKVEPKCVEAQMQEALGTNVFKQRLRAAHVNARRWNAPQNNLLTPGEAVAILSYTDRDYKEMNEYLNSKRPIPKQIQVKIKCVTEALKKLPPSPKSVTNRVCGTYDGDDQDFALHNELTIKAFWSTDISNSGEFKGKWQIMVHGDTGRNVQPLSSFSHKENEVLYAPGTKFKVIKRDDIDAKSIKITVQEVQ